MEAALALGSRPRRRSRIVVAALAVLAVPAGALASSASSTSKVDPKMLVLRLADLPAGFWCDGAGPTKDGGHHVTFSRRPVGMITSGATQRASVAAAAARFRDLVRASSEFGFDARRVSSGGRIGNDSAMFLVKERRGEVGGYVLVWRYRDVVASVTDIGLVDTVPAAQVAALARKQQARIAAAR
jgi:hypothetical protein